MRLSKKSLRGILWIALAAAALMGCGTKGQPYDYKPTAGEMKQGPGVLTGESGEFTVYDSEKEGPFWKQPEGDSQRPADSSGTQAPAGSAKPMAAATAATGGAGVESPLTPEEAREFQEFQEWKKEKKAFQEFQEWKKSAEGSAEYREFREWQEFKTYQEWRKKQGQ